MKKFLILLLAAVTAVGSVCYAQDISSDLVTLKEYGIFVGDEHGYRLEDNVTKGEFVKMLAVASLYVDLTSQNGFSVDGEGNEKSSLKAYDDLNEGDWEYPYFLFLDILGMEASVDNVTNSKETIAYNECCGLIIKALGYSVTDNGIQNAIRATELGITKGLAVSVYDPCTRENAVKMLANSLNIPVCALKSYNASDGKKEYTILDGKDGRELRTLKTNLDNLKQQGM